MLPKRISDTTPISALAAEHCIPVAVPDDPTAYHITGSALLDSIPHASTTERGLLFLATPAETRAALVSDHAITPASLAYAIGPRHLGANWCSLGRVNRAALTAAEISAYFRSAFNRSAVQGDLITLVDDLDRLYLLAFNAASGRWEGLSLSTQEFKTFG